MVNGNSIVSAEELHKRARAAQESLERLLAERDPLDGMIESWAQHLDQAKAAAAKADGVRRSKMTPLEKSQYIRAHGKAEYDKLPW